MRFGSTEGRRRRTQDLVATGLTSAEVGIREHALWFMVATETDNDERVLRVAMGALATSVLSHDLGE